MSKKGTKGDPMPGNPVAEARLWERMVHKYGIAVMKLERLMQAENGKGVLMREIRVQARGPRHEEFLVVVKGIEGSRRVVGFHVASSPAEAVRGAVERYDNQTLKLREDRPFKAPE